MLNKSSLRAIAAAAIAFAAASAFAGTDGTNLTVTATVGAKCKVTTTNMAFGSLDPTLSTDATTTATASYKCTKGTAVTSFAVNSITAGATGTTGVMSGTAGNTDTSTYGIKWTNPTAFTGDGLGASGTAKSVTLNGTILNANYVNVTPDSYTGTIGVAVNY
jgi:spore coat protein U-like protein